jgi:hypothetical protein
VVEEPSDSEESEVWGVWNEAHEAVCDGTFFNGRV